MSSAIGVHNSNFSPEARARPKSKLEIALEALGSHLECRTDDLLEVFSPVTKDMLTKADLSALNADDRAKFIRQMQINELLIVWKTLDPELPKKRKKRLTTLKKTINLYRRLLSEIDAFGVEDWDNDIATGSSYEKEELHNFFACLVGEFLTLQEAHSRLDQNYKGGRRRDERANFVAEKIALFFEMNGLFPGVGKDAHSSSLEPSGPFCKSVKFAFGSFGINRNWFRAAKNAANAIRNKAEEN
jgi:hypothetical protein